MIETALLMGNTLWGRPCPEFGLFSNRVHCTIGATYDAEPEKFPGLVVTCPDGKRKTAITIQLTCRALPEDKQTISKDLLFGELYQVRLGADLSVERLTIDDCLKIAIPEERWGDIDELSMAKKAVQLFPWVVTGKPVKDDPTDMAAFNSAIRQAYANHASRTAPYVGTNGIENPVDNDAPKVIELLPSYLALVNIGKYPDAEKNPEYISFYFSSNLYNEMYRPEAETDVLSNLRRYLIGDHFLSSRYTESHIRCLFLQYLIDGILIGEYD